MVGSVQVVIDHLSSHAGKVILIPKSSIWVRAVNPYWNIGPSTLILDNHISG